GAGQLAGRGPAGSPGGAGIRGAADLPCGSGDRGGSAGAGAGAVPAGKPEPASGLSAPSTPRRQGPRPDRPFCRLVRTPSHTLIHLVGTESPCIASVLPP